LTSLMQLGNLDSSFQGASRGSIAGVSLSAYQSVR
jgi:hypothetical protein